MDLVTDGDLFKFKKDNFIFDLHYNDYGEICLRNVSRNNYDKLEAIANEILTKIKPCLVKKLDDANVIMISEKGSIWTDRYN